MQRDSNATLWVILAGFLITVALAWAYPSVAQAIYVVAAIFGTIVGAIDVLRRWGVFDDRSDAPSQALQLTEPRPLVPRPAPQQVPDSAHGTRPRGVDEPGGCAVALGVAGLLILLLFVGITRNPSTSRQRTEGQNDVSSQPAPKGPFLQECRDVETEFSEGLVCVRASCPTKTGYWTSSKICCPGAIANQDGELVCAQ
jgi:hypothetical protein